MPAKLHVQFAAGELEDAIAARQQREETAGVVAQRDLGRYYQVLADELARLRLTDTEALTIIAATRGWLIEPSSYRYLWSEVEDYLADQVEDDGIAALDDIPRLPAPARATLVAKLRALPPGAVLAILDACERYWCRVDEVRERAALTLPQDTQPALLREVGLVAGRERA